MGMGCGVENQNNGAGWGEAKAPVQTAASNPLTWGLGWNLTGTQTQK